LNGSEDIQECLVNQESGDTLLFICYTYPFPIKNENFSLFILKDISKERRVQILEHVFFHDIKNLLTAFIGWVDLLKDTDTPEKARQISTTLTQLGIEISNEINAQEQLVSAETNELTVKLEKVDSLSLLKEIKNLYTKSDISSGKKINIDSQTVAVKLTVDVSILQRVLGNMVKNALEATSEGSVITLGALHNGDHICFWVHNPGFIPIEVQAQIFKWSFSTKGKGRGLGTYSMKLLSSRYLGGTVRFESSLEKGTVFEVKLPLYYK
jgi:signal transduction histidine kinase